MLASPVWGRKIERLRQVIWREGSDSASLDNAMELLVRSGRDVVHTAMMMVPQAWEKYSDLDDGKNLRDDLGLDSVDVVSIVSQIERRFRIRLTQQELEKLVTVGDVLTLLQDKLANPPGTAAA